MNEDCWIWHLFLGMHWFQDKLSKSYSPVKNKPNEKVSLLSLFKLTSLSKLAGARLTTSAQTTKNITLSETPPRFMSWRKSSFSKMVCMRSRATSQMISLKKCCLSAHSNLLLKMKRSKSKISGLSCSTKRSPNAKCLKNGPALTLNLPSRCLS